MSPAARAQPPSILHLYAELLLHIRTVTLFASLRTEHTAQTKAELSADGDSITLTHEGERASIRLPTQIAGGGSSALILPEAPSKDLTLRLQLQEKRPGLLKGASGAYARGENIVPWDAASLAGCGRVACRECDAELVDVKSGDNVAGGEDESAGVRSWMDLPNENWAEMMDFWHCHKPHEHHLPGHTHGVGREKGYAASNRITAKKGVGYVDLAYLLLDEADCPGIQLSISNNIDQAQSESQPINRQGLMCSNCKTVVGVLETRAEGWRIWKWSIAATPKGSLSAQTYSIRKWISAQLLYLIENQGVRKFTVMSDSAPADSHESESATATGYPITIWVFTPDLSFSSSIASDRRSDPTRAMKVLWKPAPAPLTARQQRANGGDVTGGAIQPVGDKTQSQALDRQSLSVEELSLPAPAFRALRGALRESGEWLPASARTFQEWSVGLLERFGDEQF